MEDVGMKIVVVGGVAGGASAATKARRVSEKHEISIFEAGPHVSFANCGVPFYIGSTISNRNSLLLSDAKKFKTRYNVDVYTGHRVVSINREKKVVVVQTSEGTTIEKLYDRLILAPGAGALVPWKEVQGAQNCFTVKTVVDGDRVKAFMEQNQNAKRCVIIGGGFIGIEVAEAMLAQHMSVTICEMMPHILPPLDEDIAHEVATVVQRAGVNIITNDAVVNFQFSKENENLITSITLKSGRVIEADVFILSLGVRPSAQLAIECGLKIGKFGGIVVNEFQQTSDESIYAAGDVCETLNLITGETQVMAMAGPANKQGRVAGANAAGHTPPLRYKGSIGTAIVGFHEFTCAITGLSEWRATKLGYKYTTLVQFQNDHAAYYPNPHEMFLKLIVENGTDRILGAQIFGQTGVDKRIDVIATAIHAKLPAEELADLDLAYAPQFGSARDPIIMLGLSYDDVRQREEEVITAEQFKIKADQFSSSNQPFQVIDCRTPGEFAQGHLPFSVNIPVDDMRGRLEEVKCDIPVFVHCRSGFRSYLAARMLKGNGINAFNITGGWSALKHLFSN